MAPRPLRQSWSLPSPPPTIAHYNGTLQWHPKMAPHPFPPKLKLVVTLPPNHSTLQWYPTMAPSNGTTSTAPCNGTLVPRPIRQSGSSPSPPWEVRTPIAIAIWGKIPPNSQQEEAWGCRNKKRPCMAQPWGGRLAGKSCWKKISGLFAY